MSRAGSSHSCFSAAFPQIRKCGSTTSGNAFSVWTESNGPNFVVAFQFLKQITGSHTPNPTSFVSAGRSNTCAVRAENDLCMPQPVRNDRSRTRESSGSEVSRLPLPDKPNRPRYISAVCVQVDHAVPPFRQAVSLLAHVDRWNPGAAICGSSLASQRGTSMRIGIVRPGPQTRIG